MFKIRITCGRNCEITFQTSTFAFIDSQLLIAKP